MESDDISAPIPFPASWFEGEDTVVTHGEDALRVRRALRAATPPGASKAPERYEVLDILGKGGMGMVQLVADRALGREVALKIALEPENAGLLARFLLEVQVTGGLSHPGVIPLYDFGLDAAGRPYFTMKRIAGTSWSGQMAGQSVRERLETFQRVAEAVAHAHSRGVLHRDLKPANVLVGEYGEVVVADWGLARVQGRELSIANCELQIANGERGPELTRAGSFIGTPGYAAPEQVAGALEKMGPRTDVYALGAILWKCLAGEKAFPGPYPQCVAQQANGPPPIAGGVPRELVAIARKALVYDPAGRYSSVRELLADLERWRSGFAVSVLPLARRQRLVKFAGRHKVALAALIALALAVPVTLLALWLHSRDLARREDRDRALIRAKELGPLASRLEDAESNLAMGLSALEAAAARETAGHGSYEDLAREAANRLDIARNFFEAVLSGARKTSGTLPEAAPLGELARAGLARTWLVEARRRILVASPRDSLSRFDELRARGRVYSAALDALELAKGLSAAANEIDPLASLARGTGTFAITSDPPGASLVIHRLDPENNESAATPENLAATGVADGRPIELDAGSYLVRLELDGHEPCLVPVYLARGSDHGRKSHVPLVPAGGIPPGFVYIPPGAFLAGEDLQERKIEHGYFIARTELTWGEWAPYGETLEPGRRPTTPTAEGGGLDLTTAIQRARPDDWRNYPVSGVSHDDLEAFLVWKNATHLESPVRWRLPTSDEWEFAARGADGRLYPWGDRWDSSRANFERPHTKFTYPDYIEKADSDRSGSSSIFGLIAASGNVSEWTSTSQKDLLLLRGGNALSPEQWCRAAFAIAYGRSTRRANVGARVAAVRTRGD